MASPALPVISPRRRQAGGCDTAAIQPELNAADAASLAETIRALGHPTRLRIVDSLRTTAPEAVCQCELTPLFDMSQQALAKHLGVLISCGILGSERRGLWTYYFLAPGALTDVRSWLS